MQLLRWTLALTLSGLIVGPVWAQNQPRSQAKAPLVLASQGSFFVGGEKKPLPAPAAGPAPRSAAARSPSTRCTCSIRSRRNGNRHVPGRHGSRLLLEQQDVGDDARRTHGLERVFRAAGSHRLSRGPSVARALGLRLDRHRGGEERGRIPPCQLPNISRRAIRSPGRCSASARASATRFPDGQFPIEAVDELYKQMIPDLNALLPTPNPTWKNMAALAMQLKGAILMGHSECGFFPRAGRADRSIRHPRHHLDRDAVPDEPRRPRSSPRSRRFRRSSCSATTLATCRADPRTGRRRSRAARSSCEQAEGCEAAMPR